MRREIFVVGDVSRPKDGAGLFAPDDERARTCMHEAGHVIVGMLCGFTVACAELLDGDGLVARTRYGRAWKRRAPEADLVVTLAGPLAESLHGGEQLRTVLEDGADFDRSDWRRAQREAERLARLGLFKTPDHAWIVAEQRARALLAKHWPFVMQTAAQLYETGRIE